MPETIVRERMTRVKLANLKYALQVGAVRSRAGPRLTKTQAMHQRVSGLMASQGTLKFLIGVFRGAEQIGK